MTKSNLTRLSQEVMTDSPSGLFVKEHWKRDDGEVVVRDILRRPVAAVIVAYDEVGRRVLTIRQPREAVGESDLLELPAGKVDPGETHLAAAQRELSEEANLGARRWLELGQLYASPGYTDEEFVIFLASDLFDFPGVPDHDERIDPEWVPVEDFDVLLGRVQDAKTKIGLLLAKPYIGEI